MFTGIIEAVGDVSAIERDGSRARVTISVPAWAGQFTHGESISVNGVCLTVASSAAQEWTADLMAVTLDTTALGELEAGSRVNLERALRADSRLGGHIVLGHADGTATLVARDSATDWDDFTFELPADLLRYVVAKGSLAIQGVSLTVQRLEGSLVTVSLIPTTLTDTTLGSLAVGDAVNIEVDILAKHVERLLEGRIEGQAGA